MFTPVPQGRLSLAQDVVLGGLTQIAIVPQGRLVQPLQAEDKLQTKGTASAVPHRAWFLRALAPEVRLYFPEGYGL
jgi:hypothetical protein